MNSYSTGPHLPHLPWVAGTVTTPEGLKDLLPPTPRCCRLVEARVDYACTNGQVTEWIQGCAELRRLGLPVLATIRLPADGGKWMRPEEDRLELFRELFPAVDAVDVEWDSRIRDELTLMAERLNKWLVVSYHNFSGTPPMSELRRILESAGQSDSAVPKLACSVKTGGDADQLQTLLKEYAPLRPLVVIGMGEEAGWTREKFPQLGSCFSYGYVDRPVAPGQPSAKELWKKIECGRMNQDRKNSTLNAD